MSLNNVADTGMNAKGLHDFYEKVQALITELRTNIIALHAKLDLDAGVTDTDYASTLDPSNPAPTNIV